MILRAELDNRDVCWAENVKNKHCELKNKKVRHLAKIVFVCKLYMCEFILE